MRIVTRPDFDGIVSAVLLAAAHKDPMELVWTEPNEIQSGTADIRPGDILANLPRHPDSGLWFDHHVSNKPDKPVPGAFEIAPSAAGVIYTYYREKGLLDNRFDELVEQTDIIDSADLTKDQVRAPEEYPYLLLSMTVQNNGYADVGYWNRLVDMLGRLPIEAIMKDPEVASRCETVVMENKAFSNHLKEHTTIKGQISITDFRSLETVPSGNRFLTYSLFPDTIASIKIRYRGADKSQVLLSIGKSIFTPGFQVNIGHLLSRYGGGGHAGAGGCTLDARDAQTKIDEILAILIANKPLE